MATTRTGTYGQYIGSTIGESEALTPAQMEFNALYIYSYFHSKGWTNKAIASILGNMSVESSLNPGRWQSDSVNNLDGGYGLVQWTPASKYINWCEAWGFTDPSEMDSNLARIQYEFDNNLQWIKTDSYPITFEEFSKSNESIDYLTTAFLKNYERAGVEHLETRISYSNKWYEVMQGYDDNEYPDNPDTPSTSIKKKKGFNFILFNRRRKIY